MSSTMTVVRGDAENTEFHTLRAAADEHEAGTIFFDKNEEAYVLSEDDDSDPQWLWFCESGYPERVGPYHPTYPVSRAPAGTTITIKQDA